MKRFSVLVALVVGLAFLTPQASFGDIYYVCWKKVKRGYKGCIRCKGPTLSTNPSTNNARSKCPADQGMDFNSERDAQDWMATNCDCP